MFCKLPNKTELMKYKLKTGDTFLLRVTNKENLEKMREILYFATRVLLPNSSNKRGSCYQIIHFGILFLFKRNKKSFKSSGKLSSRLKKSSARKMMEDIKFNCIISTIY